MALLCLCFLFSLVSWLVHDLFWTKLLSGIQHNWREHVEALCLSAELLGLLRLHLPLPAEQVQALDILGLVVEAHHRTVCTRRVEKAHSDVEVVKAEAAAVNCDVGARVMAGVAKAEVTLKGESSGAIDNGNAGRFSLSKCLLAFRTAQAACD